MESSTAVEEAALRRAYADLRCQFRQWDDWLWQQRTQRLLMHHMPSHMACAQSTVWCAAQAAAAHSNLEQPGAVAFAGGEHQLRGNDRDERQAAAQPAPAPVLRNYRIAKLWKRVLADCVDGIVLGLFTLALTFLVALVFDLDAWLADWFTDLTAAPTGANGAPSAFSGLLSAAVNPYLKGRVRLHDDFQMQLTYEPIGYQDVFELTVLSILYRLLCILYETLWLACSRLPPTRYLANIRGCTTFGKALFRLQVVSFEDIYSLPDNGVQLRNPRPMTFFDAFIRSFVKNLTSAVMLPMYVTIFFMEHYRTIYDLLGYSIVVDMTEEMPIVDGN